jgi:hypothetical protein
MHYRSEDIFCFSDIYLYIYLNLFIFIFLKGDSELYVYTRCQLEASQILRILRCTISQAVVLL